MEKQDMKCSSDCEASSDEIAAFVKKIKFRKKIFGGIDEYDAWKKIRKLDEMYSEAMKIQRIKYEAIIAELDSRYATNKENGAEGTADGKI